MRSLIAGPLIAAYEAERMLADATETFIQDVGLENPTDENAGSEMLALNQLGEYSAKFQRGEIEAERLSWAKHNACPGCGACSFIGTASIMQIMDIPTKG